MLLKDLSSILLQVQEEQNKLIKLIHQIDTAPPLNNSTGFPTINPGRISPEGQNGM